MPKSRAAAPRPAPARSGPARSIAVRPRADNRREAVLLAAAHFVARHGFEPASMRDIAAAAGMLPGSLYYHFSSKDELLAAVHGRGVARILAAAQQAVGHAAAGTAWDRLAAACRAHLAALLDGNDFAQVVLREIEGLSSPLRRRLIRQRDEYEAWFGQLIAALPLARGTDRRLLRLLLLAALNRVPGWYRPGGIAPADIADRFVAMLRHGAAPRSVSG